MAKTSSGTLGIVALLGLGVAGFAWAAGAPATGRRRQAPAGAVDFFGVRDALPQGTSTVVVAPSAGAGIRDRLMREYLAENPPGPLQTQKIRQNGRGVVLPKTTEPISAAAANAPAALAIRSDVAVRLPWQTYAAPRRLSAAASAAPVQYIVPVSTYDDPRRLFDLPIPVTRTELGEIELAFRAGVGLLPPVGAAWILTRLAYMAPESLALLRSRVRTMQRRYPNGYPGTSLSASDPIARDVVRMIADAGKLAEADFVELFGFSENDYKAWHKEQRRIADCIAAYDSDGNPETCGVQEGIFWFMTLVVGPTAAFLAAYGGASGGGGGGAGGASFGGGS